MGLLLLIRALLQLSLLAQPVPSSEAYRLWPGAKECLLQLKESGGQTAVFSLPSDDFPVMTLPIFILRLAVSILALPMYLLNFLGLWSWICKKWFPYFLVRFSEMYNKQMASKKRELFSNLLDFIGPSGKLSLLELGCGTGTNFKFYPPGCTVTCVDPNPNFEKFLIKSIAENRHLQFERFMVATGENMHLVADGSMDAVVCTLVLCSVESQEQTLQEVCRVLRPSAPCGGAVGGTETGLTRSVSSNRRKEESTAVCPCPKCDDQRRRRISGICCVIWRGFLFHRARCS
ncbi:methyltransferase-like protein 7A isoform X2 [Sturnira hondurensis]|uniref:methyltransferase-like protein 7A isoform X2 n=1 Tax=Sturnira hondurensis TaxID=192404 RepID=UPI00187AFD00|nr:methyltransferase-like protein 7A isoform X2 [Sturnira hondurensis]